MQIYHTCRVISCKCRYLKPVQVVQFFPGGSMYVTSTDGFLNVSISPDSTAPGAALTSSGRHF